jgi:P pilus assembly chaperone PapD
LARSCIDRLAQNGDTTIGKVMAQVQSSGTHEIQFRDAQGKTRHAALSIRRASMTVRPPIEKQKKYTHQDLQIIHSEGLYLPEGRAPVFWKLIKKNPSRDPCGGRSQTSMVCTEMENRALLPDVENRVPDRRAALGHS